MRGPADAVRRGPVPSDSDDPYARHFDLIELALHDVGRRYHLRRDQAEEFASTARLRLLDGDRAILRQHAGAASLRRYLSVVVTRLFIDWCNAEWGRWRPTAEAQRQGPVAIELERLVLREGWGVHEAVEWLVSSGHASRQACEEVWNLLPRQPPPLRMSLADIDVPAGADSRPDLVSHRQEDARVTRALSEALRGLTDEERLLVRLRYGQGRTVAAIARMLGDDQRALYRRFVKLRQHLRDALESQDLGAGRSRAAAAATRSHATTVARRRCSGHTGQGVDSGFV